MAKHSPKYLRVRIKGQPFSFNAKRVQYRDAKGRLSKFSPNKKLKVELVFETDAVLKRTSQTANKPWVSKKYSLPLAKRKRPSTVEQFNNRIRKTLHQEKRTFIQTDFEGMIRFTYLYFKNKTAKKSFDKKMKRRKAPQVKVSVQKKGSNKKGSQKHESRKPRTNRLPRN